MTAVATPAEVTDTSNGVLHRTCRRAAMAVAVILLGLIAGLVAMLVTHSTARVVETGSMSPTLPVGSLVLERPVLATDLRAGDIATYVTDTASGPRFVTHRVVRVDRSTTPVTVVFRGDANRVDDVAPVPAARVRDRVWMHVAYVGFVAQGLHSIRVPLIWVGMVFLGGYAVVQLRAGLRERREER